MRIILNLILLINLVVYLGYLLMKYGFDMKVDVRFWDCYLLVGLVISFVVTWLKEKI
ncbi:hypothetical protein IC620_01980 [Hazenella sp. IB182357]|uniref:Uncharacterized protein n=1 Tax=Polycladospora coralii TaxID=2771432 RepID=A0A926N8B2_9BACL|nr:hypothetical protein [Polycladospora coralii]MBD1371127.1 hypothetical protein [Polycladospora coralii]